MPPKSDTQPRTLYHKLWDAHAVAPVAGDDWLLYIDRHLVHELTSPQAFDGLHASGRRLRRPDLTLAVADHNVPTLRRADGLAGIIDPASRAQVGTLETTRLMNSGDALVLDIRDSGEFNGGRIPKSKNIPLGEIDKRVDEITRFKDQPVIVTCSTGTRTNAASRALKALGFAKVYQLEGGLDAWRKAYLPTEK